jgi:hypothetical protein
MPIRRPTSRSTTIPTNIPSAMSRTKKVKSMSELFDSFSCHLALGWYESVHCDSWQRDQTKGGRRLSQDRRPVNANAAIVLARPTRGRGP